MIQGDSIEYDLLAKWSNFDCDGHHSCEIGVRDGMGSKIIMDNIKNNYIHTGVDPYANLNYQHYDTSSSYIADYTDEMRDTMLNDLKSYRDVGKFNLANMTDTLFMSDPYYKDTKYAFVHFDGPHMTKNVIAEAVWFANRAAEHARFVFDDYPKYDMQLVSDCLKPFDFVVLEQGTNKICLERKP